MNPKLLMMSSAVFLAMLGLVTSFLPYEVLALHGSEPDGPTVLLIEMMGRARCHHRRHLCAAAGAR
jgi:hypothetical protein